MVAGGVGKRWSVTREPKGLAAMQQPASLLYAVVCPLTMTRRAVDGDGRLRPCDPATLRPYAEVQSSMLAMDLSRNVETFGSYLLVSGYAAGLKAGECSCCTVKNKHH